MSINTKLARGTPVTVDGFHGRGVIQYIKKNRIFVQFRNGLIISRSPEFVRPIESDYKSRYSSMSAGKSKKKKYKSGIHEKGMVPEINTLTYHAYKTVRWGVDPTSGDIFAPGTPGTEMARKVWRDLVHKENMKTTSSIQAGGQGSGRHKESLSDRQATARKEYRRIYKLAKFAGMKEDDARDAAIEAYLHKFKSLKAGGQGSGRKPSVAKGLNKWKPMAEEIKRARKDPKQMKLPLKAGLEDVEMEGPIAKRGTSIAKVGTQFCVRTNGVDKNLGCYPSKEQANAVKQGKSFIEPLLPKQLQNKKVNAYADYGEPMAGAMQHAHIDPKVWFKPPSKKNHEPVPTDDVGETNDKYLDVTKRKQAHKDRMKLLKRSTPGGSPPLIPARTTLLTPHSAVYVPGATFASAIKRKRRNGGMFRAFGAASI